MVPGEGITSSINEQIGPFIGIVFVRQDHIGLTISVQVEAVDEGVLGRILVPEGTEGVAVNAVIGLLLAEGEDDAGYVVFAGDAVNEFS